MPKAKQPKRGTSVCGAATAPADDIHLESNADGNDNRIHDAFVEKLLNMQQNAYQTCLHACIFLNVVILSTRPNQISLPSQ